MPWKTGGASRHTKKADTPKEQRQWAHIANRLLAKGASEGSAIAQASGVIRKGEKKK